MIKNNKNLMLAYNQCEKIIRKHSKTFYAAFHKLPQADAQAVYAVYAFCRIADDLADEQQDVIGLKKLKMEWEYFLQNQYLQGYYWVALRDVFNRYPMQRAGFDAMLEGQFFDLEPKEISTEQDLEQYCYLVAGSVGEMLLPILAAGSITPEFHKSALQIGQAMQLTNILRDIGVDIQNNRCYLPTELCMKYQVTQVQLHAGQVTKNFVELFEYLAKKAENLYELGIKQLHFYKKEARFPLLLAIVYYREIINKIRQEQYQVFKKKHYVTKGEKARLYLQVMRQFKDNECD